MMRKIFRHIFIAFLVFSFTPLLQAKDIVVLLDNSGSMNQQSGEEFSQCDAAIFSLQLILSTIHEGDNVYVIPAYRSGEEVQILKNPSIAEVQNMSCYNASFANSLATSLDLVDKLKAKNPTSLIMIGDGEWFIEGDEITSAQEQSLVNRLDALSSEVNMWYINTSTLNNRHNGFDKIINAVKRKSPYLRKIETNNKVNRLLSAFDTVAKQLLDIPPDGGQAYELANNTISIQTEIPTEEIFVLVQSINHPFDAKLTSVKSTNQQLAVNKSITIEKGEILGGFYAVKSNQGGLIKPGAIVFQFDKKIPSDAHIAVFYLHGIYDAIPRYDGNPEDLLGFNNGAYLVCSNLKTFPITYELRDKNRKVLAFNASTINVSLLDSQGQVLKNIKSETSSFSTDIPLNINKDSEDFQFKVRIGNAYETIIPIRINKKRCVEMEIAPKEFRYEHDLSSDTAFLKSIDLPQVVDSKTKTMLPAEQQYIKYNIVETTTRYKVDIEDTIKIFAEAPKEDICSQCLRVAHKQEIQIEITHPNVKEKAVYTIYIDQTDAPFYERCFWCIVGAIVLLLFLIYLMLLKRKKTFYRKKKKRAKLTRYIDDSITGDVYLSGSWLNRLNPFLPEKDKAYGLSCVATRNQVIRVHTNTLKSKSSRGFKIYKCSADGFRFELTEEELQNKKYIDVRPNNGLEFADKYDSERIMYEISRKK